MDCAVYSAGAWNACVVDRGFKSRGARLWSASSVAFGVFGMIL